MKMKHLTAIALALALTAWGVAAQNDGPPGNQGPPPGDNGAPPDGPPPGDGSGGRHHRPPPIIEVLDANHDGIISADEIANAAKSLLKLDKNGTGQLTLEQCLGPRPGPPPGGPDGDNNGGPPPGKDNGGSGQKDHGHKPPVPPIFAALDTDGDGVLSAAEIANAPKSLLKLDKNGDGQLTPDEYRPQRPPPPPDGNPDN